MELTPAQAASEWKAGKFRPVYYLFGEDASGKASWIDRLKEALRPGPFNLNEYADPNPDHRDVVSAALTPPAFGPRRLVCVKSPRLGPEARRALAEYLREPLETTTLVLLSEDRKPDVRDVLTAAATAVSGVVVFRPMREEEAHLRLQQAARAAKTELDGDAAAFLVAEAGTDWGILENELRKLVFYTRGKGRIGREDAAATLGYRQASNPFDFPRVLQTRDRVKTIGMLERLFSEGMEPLQLLYKISWTLNRQLKAKRLKAAGKSENEIFGALRLQSYYDRDFMRWANGVSEARLVGTLQACVDLEARLKSEAWLDGRIELESLVGRICA